MLNVGRLKMLNPLNCQVFCVVLSLATLGFSSGLAPSAFAFSENLKDASGFQKSEIKSKADDEKLNVLARDYSIHPVLGTKAGEYFKGDWTKLDLDKLCCVESYIEEVPYNLNYLAHEPAEVDAAEVLRRLALEGKFNTYRPTNLDPCYERVARLTVGFNQIPLVLTYRGFDCTKAEIIHTNRPENRIALAYGRPISANLKHVILGTEEFRELGAVVVSDDQFKELNDDPGATDFYEYHYIGASKCFRKAEAGAALQFCDRVVGLSDADILKVAGEPSIKTGPVLVWGDSDRYKKNWVYYFGHSGIPVRLVFDGNKCIVSAALSSLQNHDLLTWNILRFSTNRQREALLCVSSDSDKLVMQIGNFRCFSGNPEGKSRAEIIEAFGEPQSITQDAEGRPVYIYGTGRFWHVEIPIVNDHAYGRISHMVRCGWTRRKASKTKGQ